MQARVKLSNFHDMRNPHDGAWSQVDDSEYENVLAESGAVGKHVLSKRESVLIFKTLPLVLQSAAKR
jgi:hypothetical protein